VWVTNGGDDTVTRIDPETFQRSGRVRIPGQPTGVTVADGSVWVTANDAGTVTRIDPGS
jgi:YVTN family beta-propeller protein